MPRPAKTTSAPFTLSTPPPPSPTSAPAFTAVSSVPVTFPALPLVWVTPPLFLVAQGMASLGRPLAPPLPWSIMNLKSIYFAAFSRIWTAKSWFPPRFLLSRLVYTAAPSDRPFSAVSLPPGPSPFSAPVRGSGSGRGWGQQGRPPPRGLASSFPARLVRARVVPGLERDRSWGAPSSWGDFGEGCTYGGRGSGVPRPRLWWVWLS